MIGIVAGEQYTAIEFMPIFASQFMSWAYISFKTPLPEKYWGEWGFAVTKRFGVCLFSGYEMRYL